MIGKPTHLPGKPKETQGFTLIETMISMSIFLVIMLGVYVMIEHYGNVSKTEQGRMKLQQESRYMTSSFADELKEAGAILTLADTPAYMGKTNPPLFNGIYPLNNTDFPDGVIIATGDPDGCTKLTQDFTPGDTVIQVENALIEPTASESVYEHVEWKANDKGIVMGPNGYYVFSVEAVDTSANTITVRPAAVYFSGLLLTTHYIDDAQGNNPGDSYTYKKTDNAPLMRLNNFTIFLFREVDDPQAQKIRQFIRISDTNGAADPFSEGSGAVFSVISENIWDLQISYLTYGDMVNITRQTDPENRYFGGSGASSDAGALMTDIQKKRLKQLNISIISITDELGGKGESSQEAAPIMDRETGSNYLPQGRKIGFRLFTFSVSLRNFNTYDSI